MKPIVLAVLLVLLACSPPGSTATVILGGTAVRDGAAPISDAVVVVKGSRILRVGSRAETPIPAGSEKIDAAGKFILADKSQGGELRPGAAANLIVSADAGGQLAERTMHKGQWLQ